MLSSIVQLLKNLGLATALCVGFAAEGTKLAGHEVRLEATEMPDDERSATTVQLLPSAVLIFANHENSSLITNCARELRDATLELFTTHKGPMPETKIGVCDDYDCKPVITTAATLYNKFIDLIVHTVRNFSVAMFYIGEAALLQRVTVERKPCQSYLLWTPIMLAMAFLLSYVSTAHAVFADVDMAGFTSGVEGFRMVGGAADDRYGMSVSGIGDVNGDGIDDVAVAGRLTDPLGRADAGTVMVIYGRSATSTSFSEITADSIPSGSGFLIYGAAAGDRTGSAISAAGDVNGDNIGDFIIGVLFADPGGLTDAGIAYVLFGRNASNPFPDVVDLASFVSGTATGFKLTGAAAGNNLGLSAGGGFDLNGDGYDDIIVGAYKAAYLTRTGAGVSYVIFGHSSTSPFTDIAAGSFITGTIGFRIYGAAGGDALGYAVNGAGDYNGDGYDDIIIGAFGADRPSKANAGISYIIFGRSSAFTNIDLLSFTSGDTGVRIFGATASSHAGISVSGAGDINHDGYDDVVVGAPLFDYSGRTDSGAAFVIFGRRGVPAFADVDLATMVYGTLGFRIYGAGAGDVMGQGQSVSGAGDVNGDGIDDLLIGANLADPLGRTDAGSAVVIFGHSNRTTFPDIDTLHTLGKLGYRIYGAAADDRLGFSIRAAGDVNNDGIDDFIVGASMADVGALMDAGRAYVIFGSYATPTSQPSSQPSSRPSAQPLSLPSALPSSQRSSVPTNPTSQPSSQPSSQPNCGPSSQPSTQPSISTELFARMLSSPTYKVKNGFAFAVLAAVDGSVHAWGEQPHGGDVSAVQQLLRGNVTRVVPSRFAFAAVLSNGTVAAWGVSTSTEGYSQIAAAAPHSVVAGEAAFAGVSVEDNAAFAFGSPHNGGTIANNLLTALSTGVLSITASAGAFAALKSDGTVYAWGNRHAGSVIPPETASALRGVQLVVAGRSSFAALLRTGAVLTWGNSMSGGDSSSVTAELNSNVVHIVAAEKSFAAFKKDLSLVMWGYGPFGGDASTVASELTGNVVFLARTLSAMAALKTDGSVVTWGMADRGGDSSSVQAQLHDIVSIYGNNRAFATLNASGGVVSWGTAAYGGSIPLNKASALSSGVVSIYHTDRAFAALKTDGSVVVWGQAGHGGSPGAVLGRQQIETNSCTHDLF